jgi:hypothetical protein
MSGIPTSNPTVNKLCTILCEPRCTRLATVIWTPLGDEPSICLVHHRIFTLGRFGQNATPQWTKERAFHALVSEEGLSSEAALKLVNQHFGPDIA